MYFSKIVVIFSLAERTKSVNALLLCCSVVVPRYSFVMLGIIESRWSIQASYRSPIHQYLLSPSFCADIFEFDNSAY